MHTEDQLDEASRHVQKARALLDADTARPPADADATRDAVFDHLNSARQELSRLRAAGPSPPRSPLELASGVLGLLTFLPRQMSNTNQQLDPLRAQRAEETPVERFHRIDLAETVTALRRLRQLTERMEADLQLLRTQIEDG